MNAIGNVISEQLHVSMFLRVCFVSGFGFILELVSFMSTVLGFNVAVLCFGRFFLNTNSI